MKINNTQSFFKKSVAASLVISACAAGAVTAEQRYMIKFKDSLDGNPTTLSAQTTRAQRNSQRIQQLGGIVKRRLVSDNIIAAEMSESQLAQLEASGVIEYYEIDPIRRLIAPMAADDIVPLAEQTPYGITMVQAGQVSDANTANRKVCITDTGFAPNHEDLRPYTASNISGDDNDGNGNDTGDWHNDGHGHGTHVAGTVAGIGGNGVGVVGVNPSDLVGLHIVKVFNDSGNWAYGSDLVAAVNQCVNAGAQVISMSLGGSGSSNAEANAFQNALNNGVLSIAASGNSGSASGNDAFSYPASYDAVMSVGALDSSKQIANFSQKNSQVELAAPGVSVLSTLPNNQYASWNGTSMATPHVSGVAALVWSHYTNCSATQIRSALNNSAEDLGSSGRDQAYGYGLVRAKAAYDYLAANSCGGGNQSPTASFTDSCTALACSFDGSASSDPDGTIASYAWDFGDGATGTSASANHTYASAGTYTVQLTVTDNDGASNTTSKSVTVSDGTGGPGELTNGQTVSNLSGSQGDELEYYIDVPAGATNLSFAMSGGSGDADLYVRFGSAPTTGTYDCRPYTAGNNENCDFASPSTGRYYVMIRGYSAFSGTSLTASYSEPGSGGSINESNLSASRGNWNYFTIEVDPGTASLELNISGGSGDADLYVKHGSQTTTSNYDCRPYRWGNTESCSFNNPAAGTWYIGIRAYSTYSGVNLNGTWQ
ncbi:S8 family serine peptidase [Aliikangiella coralliicola]|uniref:S8 family serine peptidase n=1 Tax=Aliikangiella coralliicola TaxID=2592383 RepID=A0A545TWB9_9GAMM|nr:S8 family serine peptidase [Aliikangiella coralliicola]TQV81518.1 S8 family serine peptidase [Aliikangiella coralliicola]